MVIFHSYVSLPEGTILNIVQNQMQLLCLGPPTIGGQEISQLFGDLADSKVYFWDVKGNISYIPCLYIILWGFIVKYIYIYTIYIYIHNIYIYECIYFMMEIYWMIEWDTGIYFTILYFNRICSNVVVYKSFYLSAQIFRFTMAISQ